MKLRFLISFVFIVSLIINCSHSPVKFFVGYLYHTSEWIIVSPSPSFQVWISSLILRSPYFRFPFHFPTESIGRLYCICHGSFLC